MQILFGVALIAHGLGHVMGFLTSWARAPMGFDDAAWAFSRGVTLSSRIGRVWGLLWLLVLMGCVTAGIGVMVHAAWWRPLAIASAAASLLAILPWWRAARPARVAVLFDVILLVALAPAWGATIAS